MQLTSSQNAYMFILNKGDEIMSKLLNFITEYKITGGSITGIGALSNVTLGYYDIQKKEYLKKTFDQINYEMISFAGNISYKDEKPMIHAHVLLGGPDYNTIGGHLFEGTVAVTAEMFIKPMDIEPKRKLNNDIGLSLISE